MDIGNNNLGNIDQANLLLQEAGYHSPFFTQENPDGAEIRLMDRHQTGEDIQFFEMDFSFKDRQVLLTMCRAYLVSVQVNHTIHNNIDTGDLEGRMKQVDWAHDYNGGYYERVDPATRDKIYPLVKSVYDDLNQLAQAGTDPQGLKLAEQLISKYWPWTPENDHSLYLEEVKEKYMVHKDYLYIPTLREAYADLSNIQRQKQKDMNIGINFYELKTQLADLGFSEPALVDALRESILTAEYAVISAGYQEMVDNRRFTGWFEFHRDQESGVYELEQYQVMLYDTNSRAADMMLDKDITKAEALKILRVQLTHKEADTTLYWPMTRKDMEVYLGTGPVNNIYEQITKQQIMNTQNLDFLKNSLLNLGFGDKLNTELEKQIEDKAPEFALTAQHEFNQKKIEYTLNFKAGDNHEMYFFNNYDASLSRGKDDKLNQTFYINKGNGVTAKEAFNLMEGRAVNKQLFNRDGDKYTAWLVLDNDKLTDKGNKEIKKFTENYGYDLDQTLSGKGIKEMNDPKAKEDLFKSLRKGNSQQITIERDGKEQKYFISANPQFKTVDVLDHQMKKIKREELLKPDQKQQSSKEKQSTAQSEKKKQSKGRKVGA